MRFRHPMSLIHWKEFGTHASASGRRLRAGYYKV
jgi:hypothetical protein